MQRPVAPPRSIARQWLGDLNAHWSRFWFTPQDPTTLCVIRVFTGLMLLYTHAVWGLELQAFFGPDGWIHAAALTTLQRDSYTFSYLSYVPNEWLPAAHAASLVLLGLFTIGLFTRLTAVLSLVIVLSYIHRMPAALFGLDQINALLTMYLAVGPCGAVFSVDHLIARHRAARQARRTDHEVLGIRIADPVPSVAANVAIRLIQLHMCVIYLFAALGKLQGAAWWDGTAVWMAAASYEYQSADLTWLAGFPLLVDVLTHAAVYWELSFCVLVWFRLTRPLVLLGAVLVHGGIAVCLGMITFGLIMIVANLSFVPPHVLGAMFERIGRCVRPRIAMVGDRAECSHEQPHCRAAA